VVAEIELPCWQKNVGQHCRQYVILYL
jgi:hypothetical protein